MQRYYITDRLSAGWTITELIKCIRRNIESGVDYLQIREKDLSARALVDLTFRAVDLARGFPTRILVNDRADVALAAGAHGVHLRSGSISPQFYRSIVNSDFLIASSCHTLEEVQNAQSANFIVYGPVFSSPGKGTPVGLEGLKAVTSLSRVPVFALGGVKHENAPACIGAGAIGIAGIGLFQQQD